MANANYNKGVRFERAFIKEHSSSYIGLRTAGSHSPVDIILIPKNAGNVVLCQLKCYKKGSPKPKIPKSLEQLDAGDEHITKWFVSKEDYMDYLVEVVK